MVAEALAAQNAPPIRSTRQENLQETLLHNAARTGSSPQDLAPRIVPQPDQVARRPSFLLAILFTPFTLLYNIFSGAFGLFSYIFPFLPRALQPNQNPNIRRRPKSNRRPLKPRDAVARLKREFEEDYGPNTLPFFEGSYAQALDLAKKDLKFLLVVLLSPEHDDTSSFISSTLLSPRIIEYLTATPSKLILWVGDVRDAEAYEVSSALNCTKFPFTAVVALSSAVGSTSMIVVDRITGPMDANTYLARLTKAVDGHESLLGEVRAARSAQDFDRNIRTAQDEAYERSLAADRERARVRKEEAAKAAAEEKREQEEKERAETLADNILRWRKWRASQLSEEPSAEEKDVVRLGIKMPEAARITRRFRASDKIEELYAFVDCYDLLEEEKSEKSIARPAEGYEHKFGFRLVQTFPRVVYGVEEGGSIGERLGRGGNLIVEPILGEEEEEEEE